MKKTYATSIVIALAALSAGQAMAGVKPAGTDIIDPTTGVNITQLRADFNSKSGVTREQVQAELAAYQAEHRNDVVDPTTGFQIR